MAQQRRGLGKGLGALIPDVNRPGAGMIPGSIIGTGISAPIGPGNREHAAGGHGVVADGIADTALRPVAGAYFEEVAVDSITPNPRQPRRAFDDESLDELAASITEVGLLQPVVVRSLGGSRYELVMGERRWRASQRAGLDYIPAIVRETRDTDMLRDALMENLHRQQLDPLEEAAAYQQLLDDFGATHEQLAQKIGRSRRPGRSVPEFRSLTPGSCQRQAGESQGSVLRVLCRDLAVAAPRCLPWSSASPARGRESSVQFNGNTASGFT